MAGLAGCLVPGCFDMTAASETARNCAHIGQINDVIYRYFRADQISDTVPGYSLAHVAGCKRHNLHYLIIVHCIIPGLDLYYIQILHNMSRQAAI